jgi:hypothetical protein
LYFPQINSHQKALEDFIEIDTRRNSEPQSVDENFNDCNVACAIRLVEVVNDFRTIQHKLIDYSTDSYLGGMMDGERSLMGRCQEAAHHLLQLPTLDASEDRKDTGAQLKK